MLSLLLPIALSLLQDHPAGAPQDAPDLTIDAPTRAAVIEAAARELASGYVFPDVAEKMALKVRERERAKGYDKLTSALAFAAELTKDLQSVSHDKHLRVRFRPEALPAPEPERNDGAEPTGPSPEEIAEFRREAASENFGFVSIQRLDGNVGYIDFRRFTPAAIAGEKVTAAMNFVADTDALVFDIRKNGGGSPDQVAWICSYLFGVESVHLNDLYFRPSDSTQQFWTTPCVPGTKYLGKPVYVLTSSYTFSGAEEFAYNLQTQKRATIVGETTGGGANPGGMARLHDHFVMFVPSGRAINPITKTNWEGTGVTPDLKSSAELALARAHAHALEGLLASQPKMLVEERNEALASRRAELEGSRPAEADAARKD